MIAYRHEKPSSLWLAAAAAWLVAITCLLAEPVDAQSAPQPPTDDSPQMRVAASEDRLWRAHIESGRSLVSYRNVTGPFQPGEPFDATIVSLTAGRHDLYAFCDDGSFWRYSDGWTTAVDLPDRQRPLHLLDVNGVLYGVVASTVTAHLPHSKLGEAAPTTRPFDPGDAPLSIVRGDSRSWAAIAPCPVVVNDGAPPGLTPRLCHAGGHLMLFWRLPDSHQITYARLDPGAGEWLHSGTTIGVPRLTAFWIPVVNRRPTLVAVKAPREVARISSRSVCSPAPASRARTPGSRRRSNYPRCPGRHPGSLRPGLRLQPASRRTGHNRGRASVCAFWAFQRPFRPAHDQPP